MINNYFERMGQVTVTYGTSPFHFCREYEFVKLITFLLGHFLHLRGTKKNICEKSKLNMKMKYTVIWDKNTCRQKSFRPKEPERKFSVCSLNFSVCSQLKCIFMVYICLIYSLFL